MTGVGVFLAGFPLLPPKLGKKTMTIRFVEDILDDFLFDCWQANKRLTDEEWEFFGKEEHHLEVPDRDGGILCPLNSQSLTTYQHWIAGILQSEVRGKMCFAFVPKGVLPEMFEMLRAKWQSQQSKEISVKNKERRSQKMKETNQRMREGGQPSWTDARRQQASQRMRDRNLALASEGNHPMQSPEARKRKAEQERERALQRVAEGTNPFQREGFSEKYNLQRIADGTHNFQLLRGTKCWVNENGDIVRRKEKPTEGEWQNGRKWREK